jgi:hypothetical protein
LGTEYRKKKAKKKGYKQQSVTVGNTNYNMDPQVVKARASEAMKKAKAAARRKRISTSGVSKKRSTKVKK